jgi:hypothetical protein
VTERAIDRLTDRDRQVIGELRKRIETRGHFQGTGPFLFETCLVRNSPLTSRLGASAQDRVFSAILEAAGVAEVVGGEVNTAIRWNDAVKTDEVLDVLAALEVG